MDRERWSSVPYFALCFDQCNPSKSWGLGMSRKFPISGRRLGPGGRGNSFFLGQISGIRRAAPHAPKTRSRVLKSNISTKSQRSLSELEKDWLAVRCQVLWAPKFIQAMRIRGDEPRKTLLLTVGHNAAISGTSERRGHIHGSCQSRFSSTMY